MEEVALPGLVRSFICGHLETAKAMLELADQGRITLHTMPQGEMTFALEAQSRGENRVRSRTGIGTILDPRVGRGSADVTGTDDENYISAAGDELEFRLPGIDVALMTAPYADREGNIYFHHAAVMTRKRRGRARGALQRWPCTGCSGRNHCKRPRQGDDSGQGRRCDRCESAQ